MVPAAVALVLASVACTGSGFRTRMGGGERCPSAVALNSRSDCISEGTEKIVPPHCCNMLVFCNKLSGTCSERYSTLIGALAQSCGLLGSDVAMAGDGTLEVRDSTRVCSPESQAFLESQNQTHSDLFEACSQRRSKCPGHAARSSKLEEQIGLVTAIYDSWSTCTTTTTTTTAASLDLTEYFNATGAGQAGLLFPDGEEYRCCCRPDADRRSVACELKQVFDFPVVGRQWFGCGAEAGWDHHSWHNVFHKAGSDEPRVEFQGLENAGRCVVGGGDGALPEGLRDRWSPKEVEERLRVLALGPRPLVVNRAAMPLAVYLERRGSPFSMQVLQPGEAAVMHRPEAGPDEPYSLVALVGDEASLPTAGADGVNPGSVALVAGLAAGVASSVALAHVALPLVPVLHTLAQSATSLGVGLLSAAGAHNFAESLMKVEPKAFKAEVRDVPPGVRYLEVAGGPSRAKTVDLQIRNIDLETYMGYNVRAVKRAVGSKPNTTTVAFNIISCGDGRLIGAWTQAGLHSGRPRYVRAMDERAVVEWSSTRKAWRVFYDETFLHHGRQTLYKSTEDSDLFPISTWTIESGGLPTPEIRSAVAP